MFLFFQFRFLIIRKKLKISSFNFFLIPNAKFLIALFSVSLRLSFMLLSLFLSPYIYITLSISIYIALSLSISACPSFYISYFWRLSLFYTHRLSRLHYLFILFPPLSYFPCPLQTSEPTTIPTEPSLSPLQ